MKIDLCKLLGVEEGEEFKVESSYNWHSNFKYKVIEDILYSSNLKENDFKVTDISYNELINIKNIIRLPKKKQFSQDTLNFFKCIDKKWEWIAKDEDDTVCMFAKKPEKSYRANGYVIWEIEGLNNWMELVDFNQSLFEPIKWEDEEPIYIDDYVER